MASEQHGEVTVYRPEPSSRHPIVLFFLAFVALYGLTVILGAKAPNPIEARLDQLQVRVWGVSLFGGGGAFLIGLVLQSTTRVATFTKGVAFEQVGAASMGAAAILYSVALMAAAGWSGAFSAGTTLAFGAACIYRWIDILLGIREHARAQTT
jgi:hypothetical protein